MAEVFTAAAFVALIWLFLKVTSVEDRAERDARYFEWWMRSMENRKQDKEEMEEQP